MKVICISQGQYDRFRNILKCLLTVCKAAAYSLLRTLCSRVSSRRKWWQHVKQLTGLSALDDLRNLCGNLLHSNTSKMANSIHTFFVNVAADMPSLRLEVLASLADDYTDDFVIEVAEVELQLSNISVNKLYGPHGLLNWLLNIWHRFWLVPLVQSSMPLADKRMYPLLGSTQMSFLCQRSSQLYLLKMIYAQFILIPRLAKSSNISLVIGLWSRLWRV